MRVLGRAVTTAFVRSRFFRNLRYFVKPRCLVKIASNMGAVGVRFSYILGAWLEPVALGPEVQRNRTSSSMWRPCRSWNGLCTATVAHMATDGTRRSGQAMDKAKGDDVLRANLEGYNAQKAESDMVYTFEPDCQAEHLHACVKVPALGTRSTTPRDQAATHLPDYPGSGAPNMSHSWQDAMMDPSRTSITTRAWPWQGPAL